MSTPEPTEEQQEIIEAFGTGQDIVIEAGAGTGKSTTLKMIGGSDPNLFGLYLAFNTAVAASAKGSFPRTVRCATAHAVAMGYVGKDYRHRLNGPRVTSKFVAEELGIKKWINLRDRKVKAISPWKVASLAVQTVRRYCHSDDQDVGPQHVPFIRGAGPDEVHEIRSLIAPYARRIWDDVRSIDGKFKFEHDHYLKLWALSRPQLGFDYICLDEAQDTNPVLAGVVRAQEDTQIVMVGDSRQQLFEWRGAVDAMTDFPADHRLYLTQSFRFGDAIAEEANRWLDYLDAPLRLRGLPSIQSHLGGQDDPDVVLCRTNAAVVETVMAALDRGLSVGVVGGVEEIDGFAGAAIELKRDGKTSHHELSIFRSWPDVVSYVQEEAPDGSFGTFVRLIERYGPDRVRQVMARCTPHDDADLVVSTVHKVKGLEWRNVSLDDGILEDGPEQSRQTMMLAYVAVTRAKAQLNVGMMARYHVDRARRNERQKALVR